MTECDEFFDEIVKFESTLKGPIEILSDGSLRIICERLTLYYGHPLKKTFGAVIEDRLSSFIFADAYWEKIKIHPYIRDIPFQSTEWLPETEIIPFQSIHKDSRIQKNIYDMSEFNIVTPYDNVKAASIIQWVVNACRFVLQVE